MQKAAIYIRVSTQEQATEGYSIEAQKDKLISYCKLRDWIIHDIYIDAGFTGTNIDRPGLQKLLTNLNKIDIVLVYKLDRLSRNQRDILYLVEEKFLNENINFVSILENFDTSTPFGKAMIGILAVFAQLERETIIERTKLGKERRAKEGYWNGGPAPIGYDLIDGKLIVNEYEAMQIRKVFKLHKKYGQNKTAKIMNDEGYKTKYGNWQGRSIARILANPIYIGMVHYKDNIYAGVHDPIILKEEFEEVQEIISKRSKNKVTRSKYLLGGLIWCGHCGSRLKASFSTAGKGKNRFYYYVCYSVSKRPVNMVKDPNCIGRYWKMTDLENIVLNEVKKLKLDRGKFIEQYNKYYNNKKVINDIAIIENRIIDVKKQINRLMTLYQFEKIPVDTISERLEKLYEEKNTLKNNIQNQKTNETKDDRVPLETLVKIFENLELIWQEASIDEKKQILNILIKKIIVTDFVKIEWNL